MLEPHGPLFFGSVEPLLDVYAASSKHEILIIDMSNVTMVDLSGAYALEDLIKDIQTQNIKVFVSNANSHTKKVLDNINFIENIGNENYKNSKGSILPIILEQYKL